MGSRRAKQRISEEAVKRATGCTWDRWYTALDRLGARRLDHKGIVALVGRLAPRVSGWWRQMVAVSYEQARGLRQKHQKPEGFEVSVSKTIPVSADKLYRAWTDPRLLRRWFRGEKFQVTTATRNKSLRSRWGTGGTRMEVMLYPKGKAKTAVVVQHSRLPGAAAAAKMKAYWKRQLEKLAAFAS